MTLFQNVRKGLIPARLTVDDLYRLTEAGVVPPDESFELLNGEIVEMAAAKASEHELVKSRLIRALARSLPEPLRVYAESSIALSPDTLVEPDLIVLPAGSRTREVGGTDLLLVIEVSDSSLSYDLRVKAPLYAQHGVREYWVVDAVRQTIRVHRAPDGGVYGDVEEYEAHDTVAPLLLTDLSIRLDTLD